MKIDYVNFHLMTMLLFHLVLVLCLRCRVASISVEFVKATGRTKWVGGWWWWCSSNIDVNSACDIPHNPIWIIPVDYQL